MQCERCRALLPEFAEGELRPAEAVRVERHVADCAACRAELLHWKRLRTAVAAAPLPGAGPEAPNWDVFEARVLAHTREHGTHPRRTLAQWLRPAAAAAAVAGLVLTLGGGAATPPPGAPLLSPGAGAVDANEFAVLAAGLDLGWDQPLPWAVEPLLDELDTDTLATVPVLLAQALDLHVFADAWADDDEVNPESDWLTDLETLDTETFDELLERLGAASGSEGVT